jgi:hypothetical protein
MAFLPKAGVNLAGASDPHTIAAFAKVMAERGNKANLLSGVFNPHIVCRPTSAFGQIGQRRPLCQSGAQIFQLPILPIPIFIPNIAHWHYFNKCQVHIAGRTPIGQCLKLVFVKPLQGHGVHLDAQPCLLGGINAAQHLRQSTPTGDIAKLFVIERIKRDVDPAHTNRKRLSANFSSWLPFVVSVNSFNAPVSRCRDMLRKNVMISRRTKGSPSVIRSLRTPSRTNAETIRSSSSSVISSFLGRKVMFSDMQ